MKLHSLLIKMVLIVREDDKVLLHKDICFDLGGLTLKRIRKDNQYFIFIIILS